MATLFDVIPSPMSLAEAARNDRNGLPWRILAESETTLSDGTRLSVVRDGRSLASGKRTLRVVSRTLSGSPVYPEEPSIVDREDVRDLFSRFFTGIRQKGWRVIERIVPANRLFSATVSARFDEAEDDRIVDLTFEEGLRPLRLGEVSADPRQIREAVSRKIGIRPRWLISSSGDVFAFARNPKTKSGKPFVLARLSV